MSQTSFAEYFRPGPAIVQPTPPALPSGRFAWLKDWESWLTLALTLIVFLSVARSVDSAHWVPEMPSLVNVSFLAILAGFLLAKARAPQGLLLLAAFGLGAAVVYWLLLRFVQAPDLSSGVHDVWDRWSAWITVVRSGGISSDTMPFVTVVLAVAWVAGFLCSWAIFRWHNAWLALVPGGFGLLTNISYLPSQWSADFVVFLFGGMLLVMRVHMMRKVREWRASGTPYPDFLSLTLLWVTVCVAFAALTLAWWAPQANEVGFLSNTWSRIAAPFTGESDQFTRLFSGIDSKKEVPLHTFGDTLPLQGRVALSSRIVAQADFGDAVSQGRPVRAAVYDEYITGGWRAGSRTDEALTPREDSAAPAASPKPVYKDRTPIQVNIVTENGAAHRTMLGVGSPIAVSIESKAELVAKDPAPDITALRARKDLKTGDSYTADGTVSTAAEDKLKAAPTEYPQYIRDRYLQLPNTLPQRVRDLAASLTKGKATPYEKAKAIEEYLRTFPATYDIKPAPPNRDAVDYFLFEEKKGYSDYQASAMTVLLRASGVPTRLVVGYTVDEFDLSVHRYLLREKHAYAWPEAYFPGYGWVEFAPYGEAAAIVRPVSDTSGSADVPIDDASPKDLEGPDFSNLDGTGPSTSVFAAPHESRFAPLLPLFYVLLSLAALIGVGALGFRFAWERGMTGLDYPSQLWEKTIRLASWLHIAPAPSQTPVEYSRALQQRLPGTEGVERVAQSYQRARYGARAPSPAERESLEGAWTPLRNRLLKKVFRLK